MNNTPKEFHVQNDLPNLSEGSSRKRYDYDDATIDKMLTDAKSEIRDETKKEVGHLSSLVEELKNELTGSKKDYLTILGIFVSLITFVSVEIQILRTAANSSLLIGLTCIMMGGLLLFAMTLVNFINNSNRWFKITLLFMPLLFFVFGCMLIYFKSPL